MGRQALDPPDVTWPVPEPLGAGLLLVGLLGLGVRSSKLPLTR